ncbi:hypothetical protein [Chitinophaga qingshengii]|uniref:DUF4915 domain-containing protein n=1 Tax=Chitinophaga qingshengii TaxID=1569794 RepID=A0ABR7TT29_9BACT|nr:hypothetical protein [Chitinophaga qingshengii]MBC9933195.1 hypothetical protein [Chitinophaga qingshengii]
MKLQTIRAYTATISWCGNTLIDWATGSAKLYGDRPVPANLPHYGSQFNAAITSADGQYAFICTNLGTKGILLKNGRQLREINRSYYQADVYEYPAAFFVANGRTYLAHCPEEYCQLDFEDVETGEVITRVEGRDPQDYFFSRLEVSLDNKWLISKGWVWHPWDMVLAFNIEACLQNPLLLDKTDKYPDVTAEAGVAGFINNQEVLIGAVHNSDLMDEEADNAGALQPGQLAIWNVETNSLSAPVTVDGVFGNIFPIDDTYTWDFFQFPKIINYRTGEVVDQLKELTTSEQTSAIIHHIKAQQIVCSPQRDMVAIYTGNDQISLLTR